MMCKDRTEYIYFESGKCKACWQCLEVCPEDVFGKINILTHKHIKIVNRDNCTGCLKCFKACSHKAISPIVVEGKTDYEKVNLFDGWRIWEYILTFRWAY